MKAELEEGGGRILLGDNASGRAIMPQPIMCSRVGLLVSPGLPYINTQYM